MHDILVIVIAVSLSYMDAITTYISFELDGIIVVKNIGAIKYSFFEQNNIPNIVMSRFGVVQTIFVILPTMIAIITFLFLMMMKLLYYRLRISLFPEYAIHIMIVVILLIVYSVVLTNNILNIISIAK